MATTIPFRMSAPPAATVRAPSGFHKRGRARKAKGISLLADLKSALNG
jgi:hypothetical protein